MRKRNLVDRWETAFIAAALGVLIVAAAVVRDVGASVFPGADHKTVSSVHAPEVEFTLPSADPLILVRTVTDDPRDRGSMQSSTELGAGELTPNAMELAKLAMARRAIEASRVGACPQAVGSGAFSLSAGPADQAARKLSRLRRTAPAPLSYDPVAAVGITPERFGVEALGEAAKLEEPDGPGAPAGQAGIFPQMENGGAR